MKNIQFKAIIFDLDGTLLNSITGIAEAMNTVLKNHNFPPHSESMYKQYVGDGITELVSRALPQDSPAHADIPALVTEYRTEYHHTWPHQSDPYPEIPELLDTLSTQKIKLAVLSNKSDDFTKEMVNRLLPSWDFNVVMGARPGIPPKPDPTAALEIASILNLLPEEIAFIGDSGVDMQTAVKAGMYGIGALWGFRTREELLIHGAQLLLETPMKLIHELESE